MSTAVVQDVFPATVAVATPEFSVSVNELRSQPPTKGAIYLATTRVVVTKDRITIAQDSNTGPVVVFSEGIETHFKSPQPNAQDSYVVTSSGKKIAFRKDSACGCGSRLKSWRPFKMVGSTKDPSS